MKHYPLASTSWDESELNAMKQVIDSGHFTMGEAVSRFEKDFADYFGAKYAVMVNSGSSANLLMVASLFFSETIDIKPGDEVIVPSVSWGTTYYPLHQYGLKLRFVDIDIDTINYDLEKLKDAITNNTRIIMAVNLLGNPNDFDKIKDIIGTRNILMLEDNCESMGARYKGKMTGTFGIMGTFSTFFSHHISTMEGGVVVTDNEELYHIMLSLRAHGWTRDLPKSNRICVKGDNAFEESFRFILPGYNLRPMELSGAIGIEQLKKLPQMLKIRRDNASMFREIMENYDHIGIQSEIGESSWFGFSIVVKDESHISRDRLVGIFQEHGIECRPVVAGNFIKNDVSKWLTYTISGDLDNANKIDSNALFIGNHHFRMTEEMQLLRETLYKAHK